ncbi:unnamed protein product [Clavelina lepadiformis]|uniref:Uncharacterized protein n=1 Tax=Clavelina lepadiformis TaxID=159417 RepID=A0ABP0G2M4_CLALP
MEKGTVDNNVTIDLTTSPPRTASVRPSPVPIPVGAQSARKESRKDVLHFNRGAKSRSQRNRRRSRRRRDGDPTETRSRRGAAFWKDMKGTVRKITEDEKGDENQRPGKISRTSNRELSAIGDTSTADEDEGIQQQNTLFTHNIHTL